MVRMRVIKEEAISGSAEICKEGGGCVWRKRNGSGIHVCNHAAPELAINGESCYNFRLIGKNRVKTKAV